MKGFVPTPQAVVDRMVAQLFRDGPPTADDVVLDPGCGHGEFIAGVLRWCETEEAPCPTLVGVENDPRHWAPAHSRFLGDRRVKIRRRDFLNPDPTKYDYIVGNPPYVPITGLTPEERERYRRAGYATATGRMDLYMLFFEAAVKRLAKGGRLVLITPEKYLYVASAAPLRALLATMFVEEVDLLPEDTFPGLTTYPAITTIVNHRRADSTRFAGRDGSIVIGTVPVDGSSWLPAARGAAEANPGPTLEDVSIRISPGIATGADRVFVLSEDDVAPGLRPYALPTVAGRELRPGRGLPEPTDRMLVPYSDDGRLRAPEDMDELLRYLGDPARRTRLERRSCASRKPWYAFHDSAPIDQIRRPKLLWKDICERPEFWVDRSGEIVPRHSVYYLVPRNPTRLDAIAEYLRSERADKWLRAHCQRAANGYVRLQSEVLKRLPVPSSLVDGGAGPSRTG